MCHMGFVSAAIIHHPCDSLTPLLKEVSGCAGRAGSVKGSGGGGMGVVEVAAKGRRRRYTNEGANAD